MNKIFKVIYSKVRNCYVVTSEFAKANTKSSTGSAKQTAKKSLLSLAIAMGIACGGFVNVGAAEFVEVQTIGGSKEKVYTKFGTEVYVRDEVEHKIKKELKYYYTATDVDKKFETLATTSDVATNKDNINDLKNKAATTDATLTDFSGRMAAAESDIDGLQADMANAKSDIGTLKGDMSAAKSDIGTLKTKDTELSGRIDAETNNRITSDTALDHKIDAEIANRITSDTALDQKIDKEIQDRENAIKATNDRTGGIARNLEGTQTTIEGIVKVDNQGNVKDVKELSAETITTKGDAAIGGKLGVTGETTLNDKLTAKGEATFEKNVIAEKDLTVNGKLNVGEIYLENNKLESTGKKHDSATAITADGISNLAKVTELGHTTESQFTHNEKGTFNYAKDGGTTDWTETRSDVTANGVTTEVKDSKGNRTNTSQTADGIKGYATDKDGNKTYTKVTATENSFQIQDKDGKNKNHQVNTKDSSVTEITNEDGKTTKTEQTATDITNTAKDGTITNDAQTIVNNTTGDMTNTVGGKLTTTVTGQATENFEGGLNTTVKVAENHTVFGKQTNIVKDGQENTIGGDQTTTVEGNVKEDYKKDLTTTVGGNELHEVTGTKTENVTDMVKENYGNGQETNVTGNQDIYITGKQTNKIDGDQVNTIGRNQTTTVTGDISNTAENITNEANMKLTDKVGDHTRVLDHEGITDTVGNTSFKQRVDQIMMEANGGTIDSKAKNIVNTADESITNNAKVINNKASEVINNEAVNINNKASGIISSSASEIKNQADKLISNKVGENTYQNIENGKITESIKDGIKQNLTQSDADKTEHSVVNDKNATVNKQTSEELTGAVTNGSSSNVIQNTAISSNNTIADWDAAGKPTKANSVISTVDGTTFSNTEANTVLTAKKDLGKDFTNTTIKGNTITTGQATMDYAEVMKDLGVKGNANITGKTTTGSLEVTGTSTLKGDVTMESNATVKKDLTVEGTTTTKDLHVTNNATITGDVTANSYKVGNNTYIDANGINANNQKVTNVADGTIAEGSTDAVNGGQLFETNRRIDQFDSRINEVGANAAAMANLHPMEFDADSKLNVAVGVGNYRNKTATAMGLFYRPNEDVMFNVSSTIGSRDNMVGGGVSFRLGSGGNKLKNKAFADAAEQNKQLKSQVDTLQAQMDALLSVINPNMSKDFPDVPDNHWAYEAVSRLAGNDIIQGYEDGKYHGERTMTRYEMAVIIYKALQKGAKAEAKLVEEFKPELKAIAAHEKA